MVEAGNGVLSMADLFPRWPYNWQWPSPCPKHGRREQAAIAVDLLRNGRPRDNIGIAEALFGADHARLRGKLAFMPGLAVVGWCRLSRCRCRCRAYFIVFAAGLRKFSVDRLFGSGS